MTKETYRLTKTKDTLETPPQVDGEYIPDFCDWVGRHHGHNGSLVAFDDLSIDCIFGKEFYSRVSNWFSQLIWPDPDKWAAEKRVCRFWSCMWISF